MIKLTAKNYNNSIAPHRREWPKYSTQLLNIATQNCQALRAKFVGSMKETWLEMKEQNIAGTLDVWTEYYNNAHGTAGLQEASKKTFAMVQAMGITGIDEEMCLDYIKEVVVSDSIPQGEKQLKCKKLKVFSIVPMLSEVINRLTIGGSLSDIFNF